ncbi:MAG: hypothetical protein Q9191_003354, partial [Dirinaria sp. TL-2023a]
MNRFRSKKRNPESAGSTRRPSLESDVPPLPTLPSKSKTFRRNKKIEPPPPRAQVDISTALPTSDDFRTSLLMPNLSARFSMLREQDDPTSMLGKANDDSVLFPKRASRLDVFNRPGLSNIAEADSSAGLVPRQLNLRNESYSTVGHPTDDDTSRNGSIMSRAKPGESNTMFGGRQKIFKIPVESPGSTKSIGGREGSPDKAAKGMGGKALYESDIAMSAFQRLREQEKEENERAGNDRPSTRSSKEDERSGSPHAAHYNRNRETSSSTNSGPSYPRTSTAATSVASQRSVYAGSQNANLSSGSVVSPPPPGSHAMPKSERPGPKAKRLYGHGLDQHMYEQQSSAMHRLESLHRQRAAVPPSSKSLPQSRSATSLNNRYQRNGNLYASHNLRTASPPPTDAPSRLADFDLGLDDESPMSGNEKIDSGYGRSPPLSPPRSPTEDQTFMSALEPNDIGKATASGAFNKPRKQYDEQQYLQRQKQLQQGRETPPPIRPFSPNAPSIDEQVIGRTRNDSQASSQSKAGSAVRPQGYYDHPIHDSRHNAAPDIQRLRTRTSSGSSLAGNNTSFLNGYSGSEVSSQSGNDTDLESPVAGTQYQGISGAIDEAPNQSFPAPEQQPRQQPERLPTTISEETTSDTLSQKTITHSHKSSISKSKASKLDSPTLGPANGLSGLVRAHLRNDSGQSSVYPEQSPSLHSRFPSEDYRNRHESSLTQTQTFFSGDILTDDGKDVKAYHFQRPSYPEEMPPPLAVTARNFLEQASALKRQESAKAKQILGNDKAQRILGREAPRSSHESPNVPLWQDQLRAHHHARGGSTETEKEREAFANELAERRRMVQDNLKTFVETESRSSSPGPGPGAQEDHAARSGHPFGSIRPKNSRGSLVAKHENPTKAMKMLGIAPGAPGTNSANSPNRPSTDDFLPEESEQRTRYMNDGQRAQMPSRQQPKPPSPRSSPPTSKSTRSERSGSRSSPQRTPGIRKGESTPSTSREQIAAQNSQHLTRPGAPPAPGEEYVPVMINQMPPAERSQSALSGRKRSNSRPSAPSYFDQRATTTSPPGTSASAGHPARPPPVAPGHSANSTLAPQESPPSFSAVPSPSPQMITTPSHGHSYSRRPTYRKGSVNKHDISEPYFLSCTSSVSTVDLPPGASLSNGMDPPPHGPPPLPPLNPRRKRTQTLLQALGRLEKTEARPGTAPVSEDPYEERSTFSADEGDPKPKSRHKLRKSSSEGGNLNTKAKQQAMKAPSPAMPQFPQNMSPTASPSSRQSPGNILTATNPRNYHNTHEESATSSPARRHYPQDFPVAPSPAAMHHFQPSDGPASA